ncbi:MAG: hypothetical protein KBD78_04955 [Oligoflexales bacterium]|nr:hypothetical protein [Oligoflexales bacterium]
MHKKNKESPPMKIKLQKIIDTLACEVFVPSSLPADILSKCEISAISALDLSLFKSPNPRGRQETWFAAFA